MTANRLGEEASPYLRQHADNPVDWQPWDEEALGEARERDVPIFLSVGYSACHWCHVMEDESFQDDDIAERLNEDFVPIKVDREERPDVDTVYQTLCQLKTRRGGWPLSVFLTPDQRPFYVGTYFPPEPKRGQPGFPQVLEELARAWAEDRDEIETRADEWTEQLRRHLDDGEGRRRGRRTAVEDAAEGDGSAPDDLLVTAAGQAVDESDDEHGGFGSGGPKFPQARRVEVALRGFDRTGREPYRRVALSALDAWVAGGIHDHVGGGFHRYATDREWVVPHFEKMLYDNAEMPRLLVEGARRADRSGRERRFRDAVAGTVTFLDRELRGPDGELYATLDAQSAPPDAPEGAHEEGAFYVWTPDDVRDAVGDDDLAELFCERYGVTDAGNFEGSTVLTAAKSVEELAGERGESADDVDEALSEARAAVYAARADRPRPARDEKVIAAWNGLAVSMLAESGWLLGEGQVEAPFGAEAATGPDPATMGADALGFVREHLWDAESRDLHRRYKDGEAKYDAYLEDYAFLCRGALDLHGATGSVDALAFALELARAIETRFWDADEGALYYTQAGAEELVARPQEVADSSTPSSVGAAAEALAICGAFEPSLEELAHDVVEAYRGDAELNPLQHSSISLAADRLREGSLEVTVALTEDGEIPAGWRRRLGTTPLPARLVTHRPPTVEIEAALEALGLDERPPIWVGREPNDGEPTLYVCRDRTCSPPTTDVEEAMDWVTELSPRDPGER